MRSSSASLTGRCRKSSAFGERSGWRDGARRNAGFGRALAACDDDLDAGFALYQRSRTARVVLMTHATRRLYHAHGVDRLVRNDLWRGRTPERYYDAFEWFYGWTAASGLAR